MLPGFRFLFAAVVLSVSLLVFGLGAAALLRASHEQFVAAPIIRAASPLFARAIEPAPPVLTMLRVDPAPERPLPQRASLTAASLDEPATPQPSAVTARVTDEPVAPPEPATSPEASTPAPQAVATEPAPPTLAKIEPVKPDAVPPEAAKTEPAKSEPAKSEQVKSEPAASEPAKAEPATILAAVADPSARAAAALAAVDQPKSAMLTEPSPPAPRDDSIAAVPAETLVDRPSLEEAKLAALPQSASAADVVAPPKAAIKKKKKRAQARKPAKRRAVARGRSGRPAAPASASPFG